MDEHTLKALEYYKILHLLKGLTVSPLGKDSAERLKPIKCIDTINTLLLETVELQAILSKEGEIPIHSLKCIRGSLRVLSREGSILSPSDFIAIRDTLKTAELLREFFKEREENGLLSKKVERLITLPYLLKRIDAVFDSDGSIKDDASRELYNLRKDILRVKDEIRGVLEGLLNRKGLIKVFSDRIVTIRDGRYCLPVKRDYQSLLPGIVHDESHSGATYYIEPMESIELNNHLTLLTKRCEEEERRILKDLTDEARKDVDKLSLMVEELADWDLLYARARLGIILNGSKPHINKEGRINLKNARHPLLVVSDKDGVVPVDITFKDGKRILVISGANAGGKTVSLKTLGLLTLMLQSGLTVPVDRGSEMAVFENVLADIGDDQSIEERVSTFSSHLKRLSDILKLADSNSLILIDEIGTGTDPVEGSALALSILEHLKEREAKVMVTTHYYQLKAFAHSEPLAENLSVEFDEETTRPTYRLIPGVPGVSQALSIAGIYGIPPCVVERARHYVKEGDRGISGLIEALQREKEGLSKERSRIEALKLSLNSLKKKRESLLKEIKEKKDLILKRVEGELLKTRLEFKREAQGIIERLKEEKIKNISEAKERIDGLYSELFTVKFKREGKPHKPFVGEVVYLPSLKEKGRVTKVGAKEAEVQTERFKVKVDFTEIKALKDKDGCGEIEKGLQRKEEGYPCRVNREDFSKDITQELNIIGLRANDALKEVDRFIDRAFLKGFDKVNIIHGIGEGRLKGVVQNYLKTHPCVKTFSTGEVNKGVTRVEFVEGQ